MQERYCPQSPNHSPKKITPHSVDQSLRAYLRDFRERPTLFLLVPCGILLYAVLFVLIWPAFLIHKISQFILRMKQGVNSSALGDSH